MSDRLKATIVIEYESDEDLKEALVTAAGLAKAKVMLMSLGSYKEGGPHVSCRTTRMRKRQATATASAQPLAR